LNTYDKDIYRIALQLSLGPETGEKNMTDHDNNEKCDIGLIGLGVMGRNFAKNMADHDFSVAGYDRDEEKIQALMFEKTSQQDLRTGRDIKEFLWLLSRPRAVMMLVPAGGPVDAVIEQLLPHLDQEDLIIDSGNSRFTDTDRRIRLVEGKGFLYLGMGISGGETGARRGPSLMPGGARKGYERIEKILKAAAARVDNDPCVAYLGPGSAGHYVKMVHNGIEYAIMQLISETYDLMKQGLQMEPEELHAVFDRMNREELNSYLIEITADIFLQKDEKTGKPLIDVILDEARQKGTGEWTAWEALDLQVPTFNIDIAVMMRDMSAYKKLREKAGYVLKGPKPHFEGERDLILHRIKNALYAAMIIAYTQGMALLAQASNTYGYGLDLETVARIWRGGCIIRAALLEHIRSAYQSNPDLENMLLDDHLARAVVAREEDLRYIVGTGAALGLPIPGLMMALSYFDAFRSSRLPANLIMAQRDYFGAHTYARVDAAGTFHTKWGKQ
jgi:6-phosphogluconate dehydrogenase